VIRRCLPAFAALAVLAACGGSSHHHHSSSVAAAPPVTAAPATDAATTTAPAAPAAPPDPCKLVSQTQAAALVQTPVQPAVEAGSPPDQMCQYTGPTSGPVAQVEIFVGDGAKKSLDIDRDNLHHTFTTLSGIGDEAYLEADEVFLRKSATWIEVDVVDLDTPPDQIQSGLQTMAQQIVAKL
jgi:hypothetical protein